eukprot:180919-Amorphochlora_amoeboformis.AAC.1
MTAIYMCASLFAGVRKNGIPGECDILIPGGSPGLAELASYTHIPFDLTSGQAIMTLIKVLLQLSTVARVSAGPARRCFAHLSISTRVSAVSASATFWSMRIRSYAAGKGRSDPRSSPEGPSEADDIFKILPEIYDTAMASFGPIWSDLVATVVDIYRDSEGPSNVLDLASGPGEPGTMLAEQFPMAMVTMSDLEDKMLEQARRRVEERLSSER